MMDGTPTQIVETFKTRQPDVRPNVFVHLTHLIIVNIPSFHLLLSPPTQGSFIEYTKPRNSPFANIEGLWSIAIDHLIPGGFRFGRGQTSGGRSQHSGRELGLRSGGHCFSDGLKDANGFKRERVEHIKGTKL